MINFDDMNEASALELIIALEKHFNFAIPFVWTREDLNEACFAINDRYMDEYEMQACFHTWLWRKGFGNISAEDQLNVLYDVVETGMAQGAIDMAEEVAASKYEDMRCDRD
jgi:hypothetical protein